MLQYEVIGLKKWSSSGKLNAIDLSDILTIVRSVSVIIFDIDSSKTPF